MQKVLKSVVLVVCGAAIGGVLVSQWDRRLTPSTTVAGQVTATPAASAASPASPGASPGGTIESDLAYLKDVRPSQSHTMMDVGYQWTNLWFAAEKKNWPLARFYFNETRQHIRWTIKVRPIRKGPDGGPVDLQAIYDAIDSTSMETVKRAIEAKDATSFVAAYKQMLESCYACHKANGLNFLRPAMPAESAQTIINFDPDAAWPQ